MNTLIKIDNEVITDEQFIKFLKLTNEFPELMEKLVRDKITVHAAKKRGIKISIEEIQESADNFRRCLGLHRAKDTQEWMERLGIIQEEFEAFITEHIYKKKILDVIVSDEAVEKYFRLNIPQFDTADIQHIIVEREEKAKELMSLLYEEPESFDEFVQTYSLDDETRHIGGQITGLQRGILPNEIDTKVFNSAKGNIIGPFQLDGEEIYEIIRVNGITSAILDDSTKEKIAKLIYDKWVAERLKEHNIEVRSEKWEVRSEK